MDGMKLVGAKYFLDMPKGTIYQRFWAEAETSEQDLLNIIDQFKNDTLEINWREIEIYGNNLHSALIDYELDDSDDYICDTDINVVGDAAPWHTLYLIIPENCLPDNVYTTEEKVFTKNDIIDIKNKYLACYFDDDEPDDNSKCKYNDWAREYLNNELKDNFFVNFKMEKGE